MAFYETVFIARQEISAAQVDALLESRGKLAHRPKAGASF